jgi:hypothetical protein
MANIKEYIKKVMDGTVSLEEQQAALAQVEKTIVEAKQRRDESVGQKADMVVQALKTIEAKLEAKLVELNNTPAMQGVQGPTGKAGKDGVDGKDGRDGVSGKDGKDGKDGVDGKDGISVVDAKIDFDGSLVVYLSDGNEIDCGQILSPDVAQNIIISSGGSGTSQVVTDTLASLQNQIDTLTGIDGELGTMAQQNANAVAITGGTATLTSVTSPIFKATNSAGGALQNASGTNQLQWGGGGGNNVSVDVAININPANSQVDISPTGTGTVRINPATAGTIDNTSIGATTPSTVNATTITGQTGVLRGTGTNLVLQSQTFENASWSLSTATVTANSIAAPDGTITADTLTGGAGTVLKRIFQSITIAAGTHTFSVFAKAGTHNFIQLFYGGTGTDFANFNVLNGTAGTVQGTSSITSAGNGWYRCTHTFTANAQTLVAISLVDSNTASRGVSTSTTGNVYLWGAQLEIASTVGTYIPTTTTAVYGTPTLSFSGVSSIGLQSNGALYLQPAGTGALQAQATTSTTAGGNARGANAVDWQMARSTASQVASSQYSVVGGGAGNTASGFNSAAFGSNGGNATNSYSFVGGGLQPFASGIFSSVVGGYVNGSSAQTGSFNFIGGGSNNTGTATAVVTTQATTTVTAGSTAVTLTGSNANIRVGQYITGTGIVGERTYVAAISGTSLTLSIAASGSGTPTLSFFTPHGVVVGGGNNQATGSYSFIGGGGNAGTATGRNNCAADWGFIGGGTGNSINSSGVGSVIAGGGTFNGDNFGNSITAPACAILGGWQNSATAFVATVGGGRSNVANGRYSFIGGGNSGLARSITGYTVFPANELPFSGGQGQSQAALLVLGVQTTDATATALRSDTGAAGTTNQVILPNNSAYFFRGEVISGRTGGGDAKGWTIEGVIKRGANAASTTLVGVTVTSMYADLGAATWTIAVTADTTNGGLRVTFTGQLATTIRTVCQIRTTEMTF